MIEIPLSQGLVALVDDEDADLVLSAGKWSAARRRNTFYAVRQARRPDGTKYILKMHRFLTGHERTDHRNGDGLDNRRSNLRHATNAENLRNRGATSQNTSGFKGVGLNQRSGRWRASIKIDGRQIHLGMHATPEDAARAYDAAARQHFGEFAWLNFPEEATV